MLELRNVDQIFLKLFPLSYLFPFLLIEKLEQLEKQTGHSKVYFFLAAVLLLFGIIFAIGGIKLFSELLGFLYPAYMSFKALEGGKTADGDSTQWMTYWIVFCFLSLIESTFPFIVEHVKFYYAIKCSIIVWLFHPKTNGAEVIYNSAIRPYILPLLSGSTSPSPTPVVKPVEGEKESEAKKDE